MTREEAIHKWVLPAIKRTWNDKLCEKILKALEQEPCEDAVYLTKEAYSQLCLEASKWNELQICEDAVSRQAVLDIINFEDKWLLDANGHNANTEIAFSGMKSRVSSLPSVRPQEPKTGHWINKEFRKEEYVLIGKCSVCGRGRVIDGFCSYCGCRMVEPQESEE